MITNKYYKNLAKALAYHCVRNNTPIENYHANDQISDAEMEAFMRKVTDNIYSMFIEMRNGSWTEEEKRYYSYIPDYWNEPKLNKISYEN